MSAPRPRLTLVTGLYDLARREGGGGRRTPEDYLRAAGLVLGTDADLVCFADPALAPGVEAARRANGLAHRTRVIARALEEWPAHANLPAIAAARAAHPLRNGDPGKDTPLYTVLQWSKFAMVRSALEDDPFASHAAWIDFGLAAPAHAPAEVLVHPSTRVRLLVMRDLAAARDAAADPVGYFTAIYGLVAAGYVSADRAHFARLSARFETRSRALLAQGIAASDEQLLPVLAVEEPDLFEFYFGDYSHLLDNYAGLRGSGENLLFQLRHARAGEEWDHGLALARALLAALDAGRFAASSTLLAQLLDECFLAAWYGEGPPHALAGEVAARYAERLRADPEFRDVFLRSEIRVRSNFALLGSGAPAL